MVETEPRMEAFSAVIWDVEVDPIMRSPITLVCLLDAPPDKDVLLDRAERMTRQNPKMRARVMGNPVSLVPPRWEIDPNFDMSYHVQWTRPARQRPGFADALAIAERITEEDFDRNRPLWEMHVVTGLTGRKAAFIMKIHHSITDGEGGMLMMASLLDLQREPNPDLGPMPPAPTPDVLDHFQRLQQGTVVEARTIVSDALGLAMGGVGLVRGAVTNPVSSAGEAAAWAASAARLVAPASEPMSDVMTGRSLSVAFSVLEAPFAELHAASKAAAGTLNDAFMAVVSGGLYRYHESHGSTPGSLRVNMPVSLRAKGGPAGGNEWVPARFLVPTNSRDAIGRMKQLHPLLLQARSEPALGLSSAVYKLMAMMPNPILATVDRQIMAGVDFAASNVPGPPMPLFFARTQLLNMVPFSPKGGAAVNITLMSYAGKVFLGINSDRAAVPDPAELTAAMNESLQEVLAVGRAALAPAAES